MRIHDLTTDNNITYKDDNCYNSLQNTINTRSIQEDIFNKIITNSFILYIIIHKYYVNINFSKNFYLNLI